MLDGILIWVEVCCVSWTGRGDRCGVCMLFCDGCLRGGGLCCVGLLFVFTALSGFRRNGVFRDSVFESVWGRVCSFVCGWLGSGGFSVGDCGVAELAIVVVFLVFLVEAGVIGNFEIVVMGMMVMLAIVFE